MSCGAAGCQQHGRAEQRPPQRLSKKAALFQLLKGHGAVDGAGVDLGRARLTGAGGEGVGAGLAERHLLLLLALVELDGDGELGSGEGLAAAGASTNPVARMPVSADTSLSKVG